MKRDTIHMNPGRSLAPPIEKNLQHTEKIKGLTLSLVRGFFKTAYCRGFSLVLWDGTSVPACGHVSFVIHLKTPFALRAAMMPALSLDPTDRTLNPGRAFVEGFFDVTGDIGEAFDAIMDAYFHLSKREWIRLLIGLLQLPSPPYTLAAPPRSLAGEKHSSKRDAAAVSAHYDIPAEFYKTFLDPELLYTCAYFSEGIETLEDAQLAKMDYICAKLRLKAGERFLDVGCGWGALSMRAAERFGARVHGITLSQLQYEEASRRVAERNLGDRVTIECRDYRTIPAESYDKVAAIGITEHIGRERLDEYFQVMYRALHPGGLFLNHCLTEQWAKRQGVRAGGFIGRYVFPDGELLPISMVLTAGERAGFEVRDVESLREHYLRTAAFWIANLEAAAAQAAAITNERIVRIFRLYMVGFEQHFKHGRIGLHQALLERPQPDGKTELPLTRRDLYSALSEVRTSAI
jgi:cyclopropane-fatty-acyl-phospholipid synthase